MLVSVCLLLLIAELPQAILLLCSIFSEFVYFELYKPLGDLLDILVFITYPIDFFIYCSMSKLFRKEFCLLFKFKLFQ
jgi:thyrotropin-releasing hormone receptor